MSLANLANPPTRPLAIVTGLIMLVISLSGAPQAVCAEEDPSKREVRATAAMELARHRYGDGRYKEAAALFHEAFKIHPRPEYLYNAARAEQRGFLNETALQTYDRLLALPNLSADVRRRAAGHRREIVELRSHMKKSKTPAPAVAAPAAATPSAAAGKAKPSDPGAALGAKGAVSESQWPAWTALGGGAALVAAAAALAVVAAGARDDLDAEMALKDGYVTGAISHESARTKADQIAQQRTGALATGTLGAALVGTGIWLLLREPSKVAISVCPTQRCAALAVRF